MVKRSISVAGHRTSISLEPAFIGALEAIAAERGMSLAALVADIDRERPPTSNLSSAVRVFVLDWYRTRAAHAG